MAHLQQEIYQKITSGCYSEELSDSDLTSAERYWTMLESELSKVGPVFALAHREAVKIRDLVHSLKAYRDAQRRQEDEDSEVWNRGFACGLDWNADWIPGGPYVYTARARTIGGKITDAERKLQCESERDHRRWVEGWKRGMRVDPNKLITITQKPRPRASAPLTAVEVFPDLFYALPINQGEHR